MDREQLRHAIQFLTVLPVASSADAPGRDWLARAITYFPAVGAATGLASAGMLLIASQLWSPLIASLLAVATSIVITGGMHEDGLADTADSLGGRSVDKRLAIMKDSRIGSYGALALGLGVALRIAALATMPALGAAAALVAAHAAARATPGFVINRQRRAGDPATMKVSYAPTVVRPDELRFAVLTALLALVPLLVISASSAIAGLALAIAAAALLARWLCRLLGGYTGDVLGAIEQAFEITFLLGVAALLK